MRSYEFITEKKRKRRPRWAAYGPGPYGGYGYAVGYSGDGGASGGDGGGGVGEDQHPNEKPKGPENKPTMPKGTVKVDVSDVYDWYKLGQHISDLKGLGKHDFGKGPPSAILSFGDEDEEHKYIKNLKKTGLDTTDIDPKSHEKKKGQKTDPTYNVEASYPGNLGMMELAKFFQLADDKQKEIFKQLLEKGKKGLAWKLVQDTVGVKLQGKEFEEDIVTELKITDKDVQRIIKDKLAIDADSGVEAMRLAIEKMSSLPDTPYVRSQSAQLMMLYKQAKMSVGGDYYRKLYKLAENFADGKKPGRKGLAKRSGVNCKASVTSLRKTAKNSSGEKARMAHWCANMKSGRNK